MELNQRNKTDTISMEIADHVPASLPQTEQQAVESIPSDWTPGSFGKICLLKPDRTFVILLESVNSMRLKNRMRRKDSHHVKFICRVKPSMSSSALYVIK